MTGSWQQTGEAIRRARGARPQRDLADICGVSIVQVSAWERGENRPPLEHLVRIEDHLGLHRGFFLIAGGWVEGVTTVAEAVLADTSLLPVHRQALLAMYEAFTQAGE